MKFSRKKKILLGLLIAGLYSIPLLTISGAGNLFLKSDLADFKGESTTAGYEGWIEIDSFQVGVGRGVSFSGGGGAREATAPSFSEVTITKPTDQTSTAFWHNVTVGQDIGELRLFIPSGSRLIKIYLRDVLVTAVSWSAGGSGLPSESVSLNYTAFKVEQFDTTKGEVLIGSAQYDIAKAKAGY
jgi:type VI secretion system secreted protein Hcp